jgi:SagB-type dehydrogenase family enzyme
LIRRRSTRSFSSLPLAFDQLTLLAWVAQGRTADGHRTCPSAHALHPLAVTVVAGNVDGLAAGAYRYDAERHVLALVADGDHRERVARTTLADHEWLRNAAALLLLSGDMDTATRHFADQPPQGRRGRRYVWLEAGHASQNVYLQATESGLGAVLVAGFDDDRLLGLTPAIVPSGQHPLALLGVGRPADLDE